MNKPKSTFKPYFIVILAALFYTYEYLLRIEPSVMVHYLMHSYAITATGFAVMVSMYYYAYTPLQLVVGVFTDRFGPKKMLVLSLITCIVGIFIFFEFHNYYLACLARFLIGVGSAFAFVGAVKLAAMWLPANRFAIFAGFCTSLGMLGAMIGDIVLSWGIKVEGVTSILHISFWAGIALLILFVIFLENKKDYSKKNPVDQHVFKDVFRGLWQIIKQKEFWFVGLMGAVLYLSLSGFAELWGVAYIRTTYHLSHTDAASINAMVFLGWLIGSPLVGYLSDKMRIRVRMLVIGCFISAVIVCCIIWFPPHNLMLLRLLLVLFGITSSSEIIVFAFARDQVGANLMATAASFMNLLVMCSGMIAQPLIGYFLDLGWSGQMLGQARMYSTLDYQMALTFVPVMMVLGGVIGGIWYWNSKKG